MLRIAVILAVLGAFTGEVLGRAVSHERSNLNEAQVAEKRQQPGYQWGASPFVSNFGSNFGAQFGLPAVAGSGGTNGFVVSGSSTSYDRSASTHDKSSALLSQSQNANGEKFLHQESMTDKGISKLDQGSSSKIVIGADGSSMLDQKQYDKSSHAHDKTNDINTQTEAANGTKTRDSLSQKSKGISHLDQEASRNIAQNADGSAVMKEDLSDNSAYARDNEMKVLSAKQDANGNAKIDMKEQTDKGVEKLEKGSSVEFVKDKAPTK